MTREFILQTPHARARDGPAQHLHELPPRCSGSTAHHRGGSAYQGKPERVVIPLLLDRSSGKSNAGRRRQPSVRRETAPCEGYREGVPAVHNQFGQGAVDGFVGGPAPKGEGRGSSLEETGPP